MPRFAPVVGMPGIGTLADRLVDAFKNEMLPVRAVRALLRANYVDAKQAVPLIGELRARRLSALEECREGLSSCGIFVEFESVLGAKTPLRMSRLRLEGADFRIAKDMLGEALVHLDSLGMLIHTIKLAPRMGRPIIANQKNNRTF
jgi:hypothetical protein